MRLKPLLTPGHLWALAFLFPAVASLHAAAADPTPDAAVTPAPSPAAKATPVPKKPSTGRLDGSSKVLVLHRPLLPPEWGEVIQYRRESPRSLFERNDKETIHEFVIRGTDGLLKIAYYHDSPDGSGFWEIWVWDQP